MNKGRVSTQILLCVLMMLLFIGGCSTNDTCEDCISSASSILNSFSISGKVSGTTGVTINVTGAATTSVTTDSSGAYTITGLTNGKYTLTPVKTGYIFTPSSVAVTVSGGDVTVADITATANSDPRYTISGTVSGATNYPVMVVLSGAGSATVWTDSNGNYSFPNLVDGAYTVTPSLPGNNFSPASQPANVSGADVIVPAFTTTSVSYTQEDLTGIWNINILRKSASRNEWERFRISVDTGTGVAHCLYYGSSTKVLLNQGGTLSAALNNSDTSFSVNTGAVMPDGAVIVTIDDERIAGTYDSGTHQITSCTRGYGGTTAAAHSAGTAVVYNNPTGETTCPGSFDLTLTMAGGVITPTGATATESGISHMTMTSSKNFIAGTGTSTDSSYQLAVMQKEPRGTLSAALDASATSFSVNNLTMPSGPVEVSIDSEKIAGTYNAVTGEFTSCTRGYNSTTAASHLIGAEVALVYSLSDVYNKSFVYHQLQVGNTNQWEYATGQTDTGGAITTTSKTLPSGTAAGQSLGVAFALSPATGRVDISGTVFSSFQGFLSDDKKTIVATYTDNIADSTALDAGQNNYHLIIYQMNDQTYTAGALPGTYLSHLLGVSSSLYGWGHFTTTVAGGGGITFSSLVIDNISFTLPATSGSISSSGAVTISGISTYHGQMSYDGKFIVGTKTLSNGAYALEVDTK